jgi:hypothetical protein
MSEVAVLCCAVLWLAEQADGLDSAADLEVDRIMTEITAGVLAPVGAVPSAAVKGPAAAAAAAVGKMPAVAEDQQVPYPNPALTLP